MKKFILSTFALAATLISCEKAIFDNEPVLRTTTITAEIINEEEDGTEPSLKSDYTITNPASDAKAYFHWSGSESIGVMSYGEYLYPTLFTSTKTATTETNLSFSGSTDANEIGFAFYPSKDASYGNAKIDWTSVGTYQLYLYPELSYNATNPLKNIVPMIGKLIDGKYEFVPITGIIAVRVKNLPSTARKITLSSSGSALSGWYLLTSTLSRDNIITNTNWLRNNGATTTIASNGGNTNGVKTLTFTGLDREEHFFYFPVSVGTLSNGLVITIKDGSDNELQAITYTKPITTAKGRITRLPLMDLAKATSVKLTGSASAPFAYVEKFGPDAHRIKYAIAATEDDAKTAAATGSEVNTSGDENKFSIIPSAGTAGYYYLGYQVLDSGDNVLMTNAIKFCYSASDPSEMVGTYAYASTFPWGADTVSWTFAGSDDFTKGNIKLTATSIWSLTGNIYGVYNGETITFDGTRTRFESHKNHCIVGNWNGDIAESYQVSPLNDIVFTVEGSNLSTSKIGIGSRYVTSDPFSMPIVETVYMTSRSFPTPTTWTRQ